MIGLIDPVFFLPRSDEEVESDFNFVLRLCKDNNIQVPALEEYWVDLWKLLANDLERALGPQARRSLQEVRKLGTASNVFVAPLESDAGLAWRRGFSTMFSSASLGTSWEVRLAAAAVRAVASGEDVILITKMVLGRNAIRHATGGCTLDQNLRWVLHVQPTGIGHKQILCVHHPRNLTERWTTRFDWRLPSSGNFPFHPNEPWWKGSTPDFKTISSKPTWLDENESGWARPNMPNGAGHHWDVFITRLALQTHVGLNQINVVSFGGPVREGVPGSIHHVPTAKAGRLTGKGWQR